METQRIGLISDTHGKLLPAVLDALSGVDRILHAGDLDTSEVISALQAVAPLSAVRGNMDTGPWAQSLDPEVWLEVDGCRIYARHDLSRLDLDPAAAGIDVVVSGHLHRLSAQRRNGVLYVNPGSASYPRGSGAPTLALLTVGPGGVNLQPVALDRA